MRTEGKSKPLSRDSREYELIVLLQGALRREVAKALYSRGGDPRLKRALQDVGFAVQESARTGPEGAERLSPLPSGLPPLAALGETLGPFFDWRDLRDSPDAGKRIAQLLGELGYLVGPTGAAPKQRHPKGEGTDPEEPEEAGQGEQENPSTPDGTTEGGVTAPPEEGGGSTPGDGSTVPPGDALRPYRLTILLEKVVAFRLTAGITEDEFRVTGGYNFRDQNPPEGTPTIAARPAHAWNGDFSNEANTAEAEDQALPHRFLNVGIPEGKKVFTFVITPTEEDALSTDAASAVGVFASVLLTAGIDLAVGFALAAGFELSPSLVPLTKEAQELIQAHVVPGIAGIIRDLLGPELFEMPVVRVETEWQPGEEVVWRAWVWYSDQPGQDPSGVGEGESTGTVRVDEIEADTNDDNLIVTDVVAGGGTYTLDLKIKISRA